MTNKIWEFELEGRMHKVELEHGYWSGKKTIKVDGKVIINTSWNLFDTGGEYRFKIDDHPSIVRIRVQTLGFSSCIYELFIDGHLM